MASQTSGSSSAKTIIIGMTQMRYDEILLLLTRLQATEATDGIIQCHQYDASVRELQLIALANGKEVVIENTSRENLLEIWMPLVKQLLNYDAICLYRYADGVLTLTGRSENRTDTK